MTFHDVCGMFTEFEGIEDKYLLLSDEDNYYISLSDFKNQFEGEFDGAKPYESLIASNPSSLAWKEIWNKLKGKGQLK